MKLNLTVLITLLSFLSPVSFADDKKQTIEITAPWARPTANTNTPGGVFFTITNHGQKAATLTGAKSNIAHMAHLHKTGNEGGMMTMVTIDEVTIAAGESFTFAPGGHHIMLMKLTEKLAKGNLFNLTLIFEKAGEIVVAVPVTGMSGPH